MSSAAEVLNALRAYATYNPESGLFVRNRTTAPNAKAGEAAGSIAGKGYRYIRFGGFQHRANRLAWLWMTGSWPSGLVDHKNGDPGDDRWENLRLADHYQNTANAKRRADNSTGYKGVKSLRGKWQARVGRGGAHHVGTFDTPEEAHAAYLRAAQMLYGPFARGR